MLYNEIHKISAIINKCNDVLEFNNKLKKIKIKRQNNKLISFKIIFLPKLKN